MKYFFEHTYTVTHKINDTWQMREHVYTFFFTRDGDWGYESTGIFEYNVIFWSSSLLNKYTRWYSNYNSFKTKFQQILYVYGMHRVCMHLAISAYKCESKYRRGLKFSVPPWIHTYSSSLEGQAPNHHPYRSQHRRLPVGMVGPYQRCKRIEQPLRSCRGVGMAWCLLVRKPLEEHTALRWGKWRRVVRSHYLAGETCTFGIFSKVLSLFLFFFLPKSIWKDTMCTYFSTENRI